MNLKVWITVGVIGILAAGAIWYGGYKAEKEAENKKRIEQLERNAELDIAVRPIFESFLNGKKRFYNETIFSLGYLHELVEKELGRESTYLAGRNQSLSDLVDILIEDCKKVGFTVKIRRPVFVLKPGTKDVYVLSKPFVADLLSVEKAFEQWEEEQKERIRTIIKEHPNAVLENDLKRTFDNDIK